MSNSCKACIRESSTGSIKWDESCCILENVETQPWFGDKPSSEYLEPRQLSYKIPSINTGTNEWTLIAKQGESRKFNTQVDLRYGVSPTGPFSYLLNVTGKYTFDNITFTDPAPGITKNGWYRLQSGPRQIPIPGLTNTGIGVPTGQPDPKYTVISIVNPAGNLNLTVQETTPWFPSDTTSKWLYDPVASPSTFTVETTFDLTGCDHLNTSVTVRFASDTYGFLTLNGAHQGIEWAVHNWSTPKTITTNFVPGINSFRFRWENGFSVPNSTGLRVEFTNATTFTNY